MEAEELYQIFRNSAGVNTDSRSVKRGELFFGLKGENFDGSRYALDALEAGAIAAVVSLDSEAASRRFDDGRIIAVPDVLMSLQKLAAYHRNNLRPDGGRLTVIGLTGTNGKTTTKNLIREVLSVRYKVCATEGNLNNDVGVPLSVLKIKDDTQVAVIEMGASHPDDICHLTWICQPDYGVITNVGKAHILGFGSFEGVKKAKGQLYDWIRDHGGKAFVNADLDVLREMAEDRAGLEVLKYGCDFWGAEILPSYPDDPYLTLAIPVGIRLGTPHEKGSDRIQLSSHLVGAYNAANAMTAIAVGLYFGVGLKDAVTAIDGFMPTNNRSQLQKTERNTLIVDAYNANPTSMAAALDNFKFLESGKTAALLGMMGELGAESVEDHVKVVRKASSMGIGFVAFVGEEFRKALEITGMPADSKWFDKSESLSAWLKENKMEGYTILIKGSRSQQMEKVISEL